MCIYYIYIYIYIIIISIYLREDRFKVRCTMLSIIVQCFLRDKLKLSPMLVKPPILTRIGVTRPLP